MTGTVSTAEAQLQAVRALSPGRRSWLRFRNDRRGYYSLIILATLFIASLFAEVLSNDRPLIVQHNNTYYFPLIKTYPETAFGGDFITHSAQHTHNFARHG